MASLRDAGFSRRTAEFLGVEKQYMTAKLARLEGVEVMDTGCNFLLIMVRKDATLLRQRLLEKNVLIEIFEEREEKAYMRVPLRRRRENARFARALTWVMAQGAAS